MPVLTEHLIVLAAFAVLAVAIVGLWFAAARREFDERLDAYLG